MAELLIIAQDKRDRPSKSVLVTGPSFDPETVSKQFYAAKAAKIHPQGFPYLALWSSQRGVVEYSYVAPGETTKTHETKKEKTK